MKEKYTEEELWQMLERETDLALKSADALNKAVEDLTNTL